MKRAFTLVSMLLVVGVASRILAPASTIASPAIYGLNLITPNTAMATSGPFAGDTIRLRGSGSFNTAEATITADGAFTHIKADGTAAAHGTWRATSFVSFTPFGGPSPGVQGGVLEFTASVFHKGKLVFSGVPMSVTCLVNAPSGFTGEEGTTLGDFTEKTGGQTLFHASS